MSSYDRDFFDRQNERAISSWDRREQPDPPEPPEEAYCKVCEGEGGQPFPLTGVCPNCGGSGIDPAWEAEQAVAAKREDDEIYEAYLDSRGAGNEEIE